MKINKSELMKNAWKIARMAVTEFSGGVKDFFSGALRTAWKILKNVIDVDALKYIGREWRKGERHRIYFNNVEKYIAGFDDMRRWEQKQVGSSSVYFDVKRNGWFADDVVVKYFDEIKSNILLLI